ncbi:MAG: hypothetical protein GXP48_06590 [Acidobacteria bacterium]|nr:hypothetical protein [Acidobacteriota bacterium]
MTQVATGDLDRRVALLEGWKESQEPFVLSLKDDVREVQARLTALQSHMDHRFSDVEASIAELRVELKGDIAGLRTELKGEMARLVQRMDTQTRWIVGVQFLTLLTLIAALLRLAG